MRLTRREALAGAGAALLALRAGSVRAMPREPLLPAAMGRGIDLTPQGIRVPGSPQDYTVLRTRPWAAPLIARTSHLRIWAEWPLLQPRAGVVLDDPANPGFPHLQAIDAQVDAAVSDGLQVIILPYRYPRWVNHTEHSDGGGTKSFHGRSMATAARISRGCGSPTPGTGRTARGPASSRRCGRATPAGWRASRSSTSRTSSSGRRRASPSASPG